MVDPIFNYSPFRFPLFVSLLGAVGPVSAPREGAILARSPLYPLLPGALVRLMVTKGARAFAEALLADG